MTTTSIDRIAGMVNGELRSDTPTEMSARLFALSRKTVATHQLATDSLLAAVLLAVSTVWLARLPLGSAEGAMLQVALVLPVALRRRSPVAVFVVLACVGLAQLILGYQLIGDAALLVGLYTIAVHESRLKAALAAAVLEAGAVLATIRWEPAGSTGRSLLFLTATVVAALFGGLTVASGSSYLGWLDERAERLELERDQEAAIAVAAERARIAREMHDVVAHNLSVVVTLADAGIIACRAHPESCADLLGELGELGRSALSDMRAMLGVLRTEQPAQLGPQPGIDDVQLLVDRVRAAGVQATVQMEGAPFGLGAAAELTVYRIVQEALTNAMKHAPGARTVVRLAYDEPFFDVEIVDSGSAHPVAAPGHGEGSGGHGIVGMRERAGLHGGVLSVGPVHGGGWAVSTRLRCDAAAARAVTV